MPERKIVIPELVVEGLKGDRSPEILEAMRQHLLEISGIEDGSAIFFEHRATLRLILSGSTPEELEELVGQVPTVEHPSKVTFEMLEAISWRGDLETAKRLREMRSNN